MPPSVATTLATKHLHEQGSLVLFDDAKFESLVRAKDFLAALRYVKQHTTAEESRRDLEQRRRETPAKLMPKSSVHLLQWMLAEDALLVAMGLPGGPAIPESLRESSADEAMAEIYELDRLVLEGASSMLFQRSRDFVSRLKKIRETGVFAPTDECSTPDALMELLGQVGGELKRKRELAEAVRAADTSVEAQLAEAARVSELEARCESMAASLARGDALSAEQAASVHEMRAERDAIRAERDAVLVREAEGYSRALLLQERLERMQEQVAKLKEENAALRVRVADVGSAEPR